MRKSLLMFAAIIAVCSDTIQNLRLAMQLATYGYQTESPMALVEAAEILSDIDIQDLKPESVEENIENEDAKKDDTNDPTKEIQKKEHGKYTVAELLEDAKKMAAVLPRPVGIFSTSGQSSAARRC